MKIQEILSETNDHEFLTDPFEIERWIDAYKRKLDAPIPGAELGNQSFPKYTIRSDNKVDVRTGTVTLFSQFFKHGRFPFRFGKVSNMEIYINEVTSLEGMPDELGKKGALVPYALHLLAGDPDKIMLKDLKGISPVIYNPIDMSSISGVSLTNLHKYVRYIGRTITLPNDYKGPILSLLNIDGIERLSMNRLSASDTMIMVQDILNKALESGDRDVISCKKELIAAGLKEYAKL